MTFLDFVTGLWQATLIFMVSNLTFDTVHWLLHRWGKSRVPLLRTFARWHWVHHAFVDRRMRLHPHLAKRNIIYHLVPEYLSVMAGTLACLLVFPWQPVLAVAFLRTWFSIDAIRRGGTDINHMTMERLNGQQSLIWIQPSYHAMHHVHPDNFYSSFLNVFDMVLGTSCQIRGRKIAITGASGAFGSALVRKLNRMGAEIRTLKHGVDFAPGEPERARAVLEWAEVLVLAHGARHVDCYNANHRTFVELIDLFTEIGRGRLVPPEVWALGSEAELHGDLGKENLRDYVGSKRAFAAEARRYYRSRDLIYRHIVPASFRSGLGPGPMSARVAVAISLFFIRRGFRYVPVTYTTLAHWNYFRFRFGRPAVARQEPRAV
jgi:monoglucosyldiacylglycerol epimerase